ncbi:MAG: hypothetical protein K2R98_05295 [Gemmataceae bacterium]|nr:hypothetical protein [Gemmataceae bacterium]
MFTTEQLDSEPEVNGDGAALVPSTAAEDLAVLIEPPKLAIMPGTENAVVRPKVPDAEWPLTDLGGYAKERLTSATTSIFQAGRALKLARDQFLETREWTKWLKAQGIPRTSAWEAIELFEKARVEDAVANLTRSEALRKFGVRKDRQAKNSENGRANGGRIEALASAGTTPSGQKPPKEDTLLRYLTMVRDGLANRCAERKSVDCPKKAKNACKKMADEIVSLCQQLINEVDSHDLQQAS